MAAPLGLPSLNQLHARALAMQDLSVGNGAQEHVAMAMLFGASSQRKSRINMIPSCTFLIRNSVWCVSNATAPTERNSVLQCFAKTPNHLEPSAATSVQEHDCRRIQPPFVS